MLVYSHFMDKSLCGCGGRTAMVIKGGMSVRCGGSSQDEKIRWKVDLLFVSCIKH